MLRHPLGHLLVVGFVAALAYVALAAYAAPSSTDAPAAAPTTAASAVAPVALRAEPAIDTFALVVTDATPLRAGPRESAPQQALLWQGSLLEVRGERLDHLQVWDHRLERGGYVAATRVRRLRLEPDEAPALLAVVRFLRETPGAEALGIGYAAAWLRAAPAADVQSADGAEVFDALGAFADRLAQRASAGTTGGKAAEAALAAHLEVATRYGVRFVERERDGRVRLCYDGEAWARVLALPASPALQARAVLGLTQPECADPALGPVPRQRDDETRAALLDRVPGKGLAHEWQRRLALRRATLWSAIAFARVRQGQVAPAEEAGRRALSELAVVDKAQLSDADLALHGEAALRVGASRWAAATPLRPTGKVRVDVSPGAPGETCVALVDARAETVPLARRCTYAQVWPASATLNREGTALALAVQPLPAWRELWVFRRTPAGWLVEVLPPAPSGPDIGYAEFAGWVPGGRQMLVAREARVEGRWRRSFEVVRLDDLGVERQAGDPAILGAFQRWQDPAWKRETISLR
jgi:hypothetical protein